MIGSLIKYTLETKNLIINNNCVKRIYTRVTYVLKITNDLKIVEGIQICIHLGILTLF